METATRAELQSPRDTPLISGSEAELLNATASDDSNKDDAKPMPCSHMRSGCNSENRASMSGRVFVLGKDRRSLTPCKPSKARKLMEGQQAEPVWNKFGDYWHKNDNLQNRIDHFAGYGFKTLVIWEKELKNDIRQDPEV